MAKPLAKKPAPAAQAAPDQSHPYFVVIHYPKEFRRTLLEASRDMIYSLQRYQKVKLLREEKKAEIMRLRAQVKEITFLFGKLQEQLPPSLIPPKTKPAKKEIAGAPTHAAHAQHHVELPKKEESELDKLSKHLADIESRLGKL